MRWSAEVQEEAAQRMDDRIEGVKLVVGEMKSDS